MSADQPQSLCRYAYWWVGILTLLLSITLAQAQTYMLTDLGTFSPQSVNKWGDLCGSLNGFPARWEAGWTAPQLMPGANTPGRCMGVNNYKQYAGFRDINGREKARYFGPAYPTIQSPRLPPWAEFSWADAVNDSRELVGGATGGEHACALRWPTPQTQPTCLVDTGLLGPTPSMMLNQKGQAAGTFDLSGDPGAVFSHLRGATTITWLERGNAWAMNNLGWLVGDDGIIDGSRGQVWLPDGRTFVLDPSCPQPGDTFTHMFLTGVNQAVSAVGYMGCVFASYPFRWDH